MPSQIERCIEIAEEQIQPKWDKKELHEFIIKDTPPRTERQIAILKVLIEITNRVESLGKERFIEEKWENEKKSFIG